MPLSRYMELCLSHEEHGYYRTRDPLGTEGDFTTAPEISQMFGELIGLWIVDVWQKMGSPADFALVELGPGRGTLMADALRALKTDPHCTPDLFLVETSPVLRSLQQTRLTGTPLRSTWLTDWTDIPPKPTIIVANEFFDALPIDQFTRKEEGWRQTVIGVDEEGGLTRQPGPVAALDTDHPVGNVVERSETGLTAIENLTTHLQHHGGAILIIDYGPEDSAPGDSLQALQNGAYADPFADPGLADLTAHVDFAALKKTALAGGGHVHGPVPQAAFLDQLGLFARAKALKQNATPAQRREIDLAAHRLTAPDQMGTLFKAMAIASPGMPPPAGFSL